MAQITGCPPPCVQPLMQVPKSAFTVCKFEAAANAIAGIAIAVAFFNMLEGVSSLNVGSDARVLTANDVIAFVIRIFHFSFFPCHAHSLMPYVIFWMVAVLAKIYIYIK